LRIVFYQGVCHRWRRIRKSGPGGAELQIGVYPEHPVSITIIPVIAELVRHKEDDQQTDRQTGSQPCNINNGKGFFLPQTAQGATEIMLPHGKTIWSID